MENPPTMPRIAIACGGTGGHLFPGLAVARQLADRGCAVTLLVSPKEVDQQAVRDVQGVEVVTLPAVALQRGSRLAFLRGFVRSYQAARRRFRDQPPHAALAMGGFTSVPPVLAARRRGARAFLHESNTIPGRANRVLARFVDVAFLGFPEAVERLRVRQAVVTGTPVRSEFQRLNPAQCREELGLDPSHPVVLVMGGSQGASGVNDLVLRSLPLLQRAEPDWQWLHLSGPNDLEKVRAGYAAAGLRATVHAFFNRMELVLSAADAAVTRSGASSLAELAALQLPALLVPLPTAADNHQFFNARAFERSGAARRIDQQSATPEQLLEHLRVLVMPGPERTAVQTALAAWHVPDAAANIAAQIIASLPAQLRRGAISASSRSVLSGAERSSYSSQVEVAV